MTQQIMKTFRTLFLFLMASVLMLTANAAQKPTPVDAYLPLEKMVVTAALVVDIDPGMIPIMDKIEKVMVAMPEKEREELLSKIQPGEPIPNDARLGWTDESYAEYMKVWKKRQIRVVGNVGLGLYHAGNNIWNLVSMNQKSQPLPLSTLRYDAQKKEWKSPNGVLKLKGDVTFDDTNMYGAWSGKEWVLESKTMLSTLTETLVLGKTKDKRNIYFVYHKVEKDGEGRLIDNQSVVLRVPTSAVEKDPLLEKAKARSLK